jgi:stage IV sporulation protein B
MVVGLADLVSDGHTVNPAKAAGIRPGDVITSINGEPVGSNEDVARIVSGSAGGTLRLCITRETREEKELTLCPVLCDDGLGYKAGMWVRDSSAGIGTMTWLDPESGMFAGLGHAVCDIDTGDRMPLYSGEAVNVTITGVTRGESGRPGELRGTFSGGVPIGILTRNDITGVYGRLEGTKDFAQEAQLPIARREEIRTGKACIRATVDGGGVKEYEIVIERIDLREDHPTRNMVLRITDPKLLAVTGGIVQGMSGSPIIQSGKLVGAVTHVLVNDPTRGYGIFIENMLEAAE